MTDVKNVVCVYGEDVVGDGWTWFFNEDTGELIRTFEYPGQDSGYETALQDFGVNVRSLRLEQGKSGMGWEELADWWDEIQHEPLPAIVAAASGIKLDMTWEEGN